MLTIESEIRDPHPHPILQIFPDLASGLVSVQDFNTSDWEKASDSCARFKYVEPTPYCIVAPLDKLRKLGVERIIMNVSSSTGDTSMHILELRHIVGLFEDQLSRETVIVFGNQNHAFSQALRMNNDEIVELKVA